MDGLAPAVHQDFRISTDPDGTIHAVNPLLAVTVLPDGTPGYIEYPDKESPVSRQHGARVAHQREQRPFHPGGAETRSALIAQLDDVNVYVLGNRIVVTKRRLPLWPVGD